MIRSESVLHNSPNDRLAETCRIVYENMPIRTRFRPILQEGTVEVEMQTVGRKFLRGSVAGSVAGAVAGTVAGTRTRMQLISDLWTYN